VGESARRSPFLALCATTPDRWLVESDSAESSRGRFDSWLGVDKPIIGWMSDHRIDLAALAAAVLGVFVAGVVLGRAMSAVIALAIGLVAGIALGSPVGAAALTLVVMFSVAVFFGGSFVLVGGAVLVAAASAVVVGRRPAVAGVVRRVTTGEAGVPLPRLSVWALAVAPLVAAVAAFVIPPPGDLVGLSGTSRHVMTGLGVVALFVLTGVFVARRARAAGAHRSHALVWGVVSAAMVLVWAFGIFVVGYALDPFKGGSA
jgi:hypothetical protein